MHPTLDLHFIASASQWYSPPLGLSLKTTHRFSFLLTRRPTDRFPSRRNKNVSYDTLQHWIGICPERCYLPLFSGQSAGPGVSQGQINTAYSSWLQGL